MLTRSLKTALLKSLTVCNYNRKQTGLLFSSFCTGKSSSKAIDNQVYHVSDKDEFDYYKYSHVKNYDYDEILKILTIPTILSVLQNHNFSDIKTIDVPIDNKFVDQIVIATGKSLRHISQVAFLLRKLVSFIAAFYILKHLNTMKNEGINDYCPSQLSSTFAYGGWAALDLGSTIVHLFLDETRLKYDLESLWSLQNDQVLKVPVQKSIAENKNEYSYEDWDRIYFESQLQPDK